MTLGAAELVPADAAQIPVVSTEAAAAVATIVMR